MSRRRSKKADPNEPVPNEPVPPEQEPNEPVPPEPNEPVPPEPVPPEPVPEPVPESDLGAEADAEADADAEAGGDEADPDEDEETFEDDEEGPGLEKATAAPASSDHLKTILESLLFVAEKPLTIKILAKIARTRVADVEPLVDQLILDYRGRGIELVEVAGGFQFRSAASSAPFVRELVAKKPARLTRAQIESLAILAYRQPMTRPELEEIRGVDCGSALKVLLDKGLLRILGRKDEAGRPLLYGTTPQFLEFFGLASLGDLPTLREIGELTEESRALFQRKMGEQIETIGDIAIEQHHYTDEEIEALEREARGEPDQQELRDLGAASDDEEDGEAPASAGDGEEDE